MHKYTQTHSRKGPTLTHWGYTLADVTAAHQCSLSDHYGERALWSHFLVGCGAAVAQAVAQEVERVGW